jgi:hypothetical protein
MLHVGYMFEGLVKTTDQQTCMETSLQLASGGFS